MITRQRGAVQALNGVNAPEGSDCVDPRQEDRRRGTDGQLGEEEDQELEARDAPTILATRRLKSTDGVETIAALAGYRPGDQDRRSLPRHKSIVLTPAERQVITTQLGRVSACGTSFVELRRGEARGARVVEQRLVVAAKCHNRMCRPCDEERRRREAVRLEGRWRTFWTMGLPSGAYSAGDAWRMVSKWVSRFFRALRDAEREAVEAADVRIAREERRRVDKENEAGEYGRSLAALQYAWCLEPHQSGYPHVHWVCNAHFVSQKWIKETWSRIIGATVKWIFVRRVKAPKGVCRYLAKYQAKTVFTVEIAALLYRKRTYTTTRRREDPPPSTWKMEPKREGTSLYVQTVDAELWAAVNGWKTVGKDAGGYALWERTFTPQEWERYTSEKYTNVNEWTNKGQCNNYEYEEMEDRRAEMRSGRAFLMAVRENEHKQRGRALVSQTGEYKRTVSAWCERGAGCPECLTLARIL